MSSLKYFWLLFLLVLSACSSLPEDALSDMQLQNSYSETPDFIIIGQPTGINTQGIVFYPGGFVDAHAYLPLQDKLVSEVPGLVIVTVKMPANLAVLGIEKGMKVLSLYPEISNWYIAGHSLGGTMGAELVSKHPETFKSLIFLASYPASDILKTWNGAVLSIHASKDGLSTLADIESYKVDLPSPVVMENSSDFDLPLQSKTHYYNIVGGNHAQFGSYGLQTNDSVADISTANQQSQIIKVIKNYISNL